MLALWGDFVIIEVGKYRGTCDFTGAFSGRKAKGEGSMELEFDVKMTPQVMYDYLLQYTYNSMSGILGTLVGVFLLMGFVATGYPIYLIAGLVVILYLPVNLYVKAHQQVQSTPAFKEPLHYKMTEEGISVSQGDTVETQAWENCYKAVSTNKSIILYTSKTTASIFPKNDLGEKKDGLVAMISTHMEPKKVKIKQ